MLKMGKAVGTSPNSSKHSSYCDGGCLKSLCGSVDPPLPPILAPSLQSEATRQYFGESRLVVLCKWCVVHEWVEEGEDRWGVYVQRLAWSQDCSIRVSVACL